MVSVVFIAVLAVLGGLAAAVIIFGIIALVFSPTQAERIALQQFETQRAIDLDHQAARRAMNEAAGQSWRNLVD